MPPIPPPSRSDRTLRGAASAPTSRLVRPLAALTLAALSLGCHPRPGAPGYPTADRLPDGPRQPDGVALDPLPAATTGQPRGHAPSSNVIALQPPLPRSSAPAVLPPLLEAISQEDMAALTPLFTERATWVNLPSRATVPALVHFRERLRRLDYQQLIGQVVLRESDAEVYTLDELDALPPGRPARPPEMGPTDVLLRVRVLVPRVGADRLFGDSWLLVLRPEQGHFRIHSLQEEFQLP